MTITIANNATYSTGTGFPNFAYTIPSGGKALIFAVEGRSMTTLGTPPTFTIGATTYTTLEIKTLGSDDMKMGVYLNPPPGAATMKPGVTGGYGTSFVATIMGDVDQRITPGTKFSQTYPGTNPTVSPGNAKSGQYIIYCMKRNGGSDIAIASGSSSFFNTSGGVPIGNQEATNGSVFVNGIFGYKAGPATSLSFTADAGAVFMSFILSEVSTSTSNFLQMF